MTTPQCRGEKEEGANVDTDEAQTSTNRKRGYESFESGHPEVHCWDPGQMQLPLHIQREKCGNTVPPARSHYGLPPESDSLLIELYLGEREIWSGGLSVDTRDTDNWISENLYQRIQSSSKKRYKNQSERTVRWGTIEATFFVEGFINDQYVIERFQHQKIDFRVTSDPSAGMIFGSDMMRRLDLTDAGETVPDHEDPLFWGTNDNGDDDATAVEAQDQSDSQKTKREAQGIILKSGEKERLVVSYTISEDWNGDENSVKRSRLAQLSRDRDFNTSKLFRQERPIMKLHRTGENPLKALRFSRQDLAKALK